MENLYCTIFIVDISQNPDEVETVTSRIQQLIEDHGGVIKKTDRWGKKRLAYQIRKKTHGFYVEIEFNANSRLNIPKILEGEYRLNDRVLRNFTYVVPKKELRQRELLEKRKLRIEEAKSIVKEEPKEIVKETAKEVPTEEVVEVIKTEVTPEVVADEPVVEPVKENQDMVDVPGSEETTGEKEKEGE